MDIRKNADGKCPYFCILYSFIYYYYYYNYNYLTTQGLPCVSEIIIQPIKNQFLFWNRKFITNIKKTDYDIIPRGLIRSMS